MEAKKRKKLISFEEAMGKLESIVKTLEDGNIPLEKLVATYQEGLVYQKICQKHLEQATSTLDSLKEQDSTSDEPHSL
jgi:exodeoxyribonuclease VII small subunit